MADESKLEAVIEPAKDMDVETLHTADRTDGDATVNGSKRSREEGNEPEEEEDNGGEGKKLKVEESAVEEYKLETADGEKKETDTVPTGPVTVGLKRFDTGAEMFDYFHNLLHSWSPNFNVNKYEHLMLLDLLKKGCLEPEKKIKEGVHAFQVRFHPKYKNRCFFLIRENGSFDDFSIRKSVNHILPLPENMKLKEEEFGGGRGGGGRGHWRGGRGRGGGKPRN